MQFVLEPLESLAVIFESAFGRLLLTTKSSRRNPNAQPGLRARAHDQLTPPFFFHCRSLAGNTA
jgi:hypothetical protein